MKKYWISKFFILTAICGLFLFGLPIYPKAFSARREAVRGQNAMVASQHELASKVGVEIIKKGGNAVDAAIAVGLALAVVYPEAGNIGGGGFMLIGKPSGEAHVIDYREMAPQAASRDMYVDKDGNLVKGDGSSLTGYRAVGVPGTVAGFDLAFKKYGSGKVKWKDLVEPSRVLASEGFSLSQRLAEKLKDSKDGLAMYEDSNRIFLNSGKYYGQGDVLRQPELAVTLARIAKKRAKEFYTGRTAKMIADDMKTHRGLITADDFKNYRAVERTPLRGNYRGHEIITVPPPSSGGVVMLEVLNILEGYDLRKMPHDSATKHHLVAEAMRRGFADRAEFMGDPDFVKVPVTSLVDKAYAARRRSSIDRRKASNSIYIRHGVVTGVEPTETTQYSIIDPSGMVVTNIYTLNDLYGSKVTAKGTGVLLNNEMDDFTSQPGKPNLYGLVQGERNAIQPGKRPLSSMTPTIVLRKDGSFWFALGARGGPRITSAVLQTIINVIDYDMDIQAAIDTPRIHHQWLPDEITYEPDEMSPDTVSILTGFGHKFAAKPEYIAAATGIMVDEKGVRLGAIDKRSDGMAVGY
ncbi:MAG: gamma-glutamyltransferase [Pyrinomonadaceae bacterium]